MRTPAAWAQVTWKEVEQCSQEHWIQAPDTFFIRFRQYTHFWGDMGRKWGSCWHLVLEALRTEP